MFTGTTPVGKALAESLAVSPGNEVLGSEAHILLASMPEAKVPVTVHFAGPLVKLRVAALVGASISPPNQQSWVSGSNPKDLHEDESWQICWQPRAFVAFLGFVMPVRGVAIFHP